MGVADTLTLGLAHNQIMSLVPPDIRNSTAFQIGQGVGTAATAAVLVSCGIGGPAFMGAFMADVGACFMAASASVLMYNTAQNVRDLGMGLITGDGERAQSGANGLIFDAAMILIMHQTMKAAFPEPEPLAPVRAPGKGFKSFNALKQELGPAGEGKVWHHIVEQSQIDRFGAEAIHNTGNVVAVTPEVNTSINALYSSIRPGITGSTSLTVRQWLRTKSYDAAKAFGQRAIENVSKGTWP